jgi:hypothetical protein
VQYFSNCNFCVSNFRERTRCIRFHSQSLISTKTRRDNITSKVTRLWVSICESGKSVSLLQSFQTDSTFTQLPFQWLEVAVDPRVKRRKADDSPHLSLYDFVSCTRRTLPFILLINKSKFVTDGDYARETALSYGEIGSVNTASHNCLDRYKFFYVK